MCTSHTEHSLIIDIEFNKTLTIEFPHPLWAQAFRNYIASNAYHIHKQTSPAILGQEDNQVRIYLPRNLGYVQMREVEVDRRPIACLMFVFSNPDSARAWRENSRLWQETTNDRKVYIPIAWMHGTYDEKMNIRTSFEQPRAADRAIHSINR